MKRLAFYFSLICFCSVFCSCIQSSENDIWIIQNDSKNSVTVKFDGIPQTYSSKTTDYFHYSRDAVITIDDSFHVNFRYQPWFQNDETYRKLFITDQTVYNYSILNSTSNPVTFTNSGSSYTIAAGATENYTFYKTKPALVFYSNNFQLSYTENLVDNTYYIYIN